MIVILRSGKRQHTLRSFSSQICHWFVFIIINLNIFPSKFANIFFLKIVANLCLYFLTILCLSNIRWNILKKNFTFQWQSARQRIGCIIRIVCRCNFVNLNNFDNLNNFVNLYKVNSCLASYSPRPTTSNQPTYRAPNEATKPICDQESIWPFLGQTS